ncbi:glutamate receptor U1-like [Physella acuta]|uniref:glutamate receptor U1-like n=1 Tax=Physella acuta TaxID=109671 RepID=UPI0027DE0544|nr:glutamate receptor U1-like [Physella acuta]
MMSLNTSSTMTSPLPVYDVVVMEEAPFVMTETDSEGKTTYTGLAMDVLKKVAEKAAFGYNIKLVNHDSYGYQDYTGKWKGLISELGLNADIAVGPIPKSVKAEGNEIVDFTRPYMSSGISLLIKYPPETTRGIGLMLEPFSTEVWIMICLAFIVISLALFLIGRFSPFEWSRVSREKDVRMARSSFGLKNSFLFAASTLGWQGYREAPRSISGRILMCMWFMFTVFVIVAYTACLCAILTTRAESSPQQLPFSNYEDIVESKQVKLGALKYNHIYRIFKESKMAHNNIFAQLYTYIDDSQEWIQQTSEGIQRVKDSGGKYAMLMETVKADYITATNCDLITYGEKISPFGYSFAVNKNSPLLERMNLAILELQEDSSIIDLFDKYFVKRQVCPKYDKSKLVPQKGGGTHRKVSSMDMKDMAIPFLFLFLGVLGAGGALGAEIYYKKWLATRADTDDKAKKPLNTESGTTKAPKTSPPPPPIYKVNNKLQEEADKKGTAVVVITENPAAASEEEADSGGNSFEMVPLDDKVEADREGDAQQIEAGDSTAEVIKGDKSADKAEVINEIA